MSQEKFTFILWSCRECTREIASRAAIRLTRQSGVDIIKNLLREQGIMPNTNIMVKKEKDASIWLVIDGMHRVTAIPQLNGK